LPKFTPIFHATLFIQSIYACFEAQACII
jgi:hypothetical protein